ncbi:28 kDa inner dynein arm light chain, axonemal [Trichonephila clavata]|uniref:28 kDa inner dynein arm light chain, axonemal n=1 Tax=Trichonephila clavata TaxID=2740835 RepID=A0A8X6F723_TRICU|nr:28 kDa inner dynein arm light chain, axonemal [Trichonephila clavata]
MATSLSEMIAAPSISLVKYETPTLVTTREADGKATRRDSRLPNIRDKPSSPKSSRQDSKNKDHQVAEILDAILPPREFEDDGKLWIQPVSRTPATRLDVVNLAEKLDNRLIERNAREIGICPIRRELYDQCFDELIRQETLNCVERGLLFVRIRDELRMSLAAYENLYDSGVAFGIRKTLLSERGKMDIVDRMYPEYSYPWYPHSRTITPLYSKDLYTRKALLSINAARTRVRNLLNYQSYRLPAIQLSPESRYNLYRKRARHLSLE